MNESINLLEPNKNTQSAAFLRKIHKMRIVTIALLFIVSVSSIILFILVALSPLPALQRQEQFLQQTLSASKDSMVKLSFVNTQADAISGLINKRKSFDQPISLIQAKLSSDMNVQQIQVDDTSVLVTVESNSLLSLETFLNGLVGYVQSKNTFSNVTLIDLVQDQATNGYALTIQLNYL